LLRRRAAGRLDHPLTAGKRARGDFSKNMYPHLFDIIRHRSNTANTAQSMAKELHMQLTVAWRGELRRVSITGERCVFQSIAVEE
jgi:hypothetical protein